MTSRDTFIAALREMADFLEARPGIETPRYTVVNVFVDTREDVAAMARLATWEKVYNGEWFSLRKSFADGAINYEVNANRGLVCRKVVKGMRTIEAQPARTIEDVEWVCEDSLLETR